MGGVCGYRTQMTATTYSFVDRTVRLCWISCSIVAKQAVDRARRQCSILSVAERRGIRRLTEFPANHTTPTFRRSTPGRFKAAAPSIFFIVFIIIPRRAINPRIITPGMQWRASVLAAKPHYRDADQDTSVLANALRNNGCNNEHTTRRRRRNTGIVINDRNRKARISASMATQQNRR